MRTTWFLFALAATVVACGDDEAAGSGGSSSSSGDSTTASTTTAAATSGGGGEGGGLACPRGSHVEGDACVSTLTEWTTAPSLAQKRDHHATAVVDSAAGPFLVVLGGTVDNGPLLDSIEMAPIQADGTLGAFSDGGRTPEVAAGSAIAVVDHTVVVVGGFRQTSGGGPRLSAQADVAQVGADGRLGAWAAGPELRETRFHAAAAVDGRTIYVVGGLTGNNTVNTPLVERSVVGADGALGSWAEDTPLPAPRSHHGLVAAQGGLWVTGGLTGNPAGVHTDFDDVLFAPILDDGGLGAWATVGALPAKLGTHSSFVDGGYLYVAGGVKNNTSNTDEVWRAAIADGGTLGAWEAMPPLPTARAHAHQTPVFDGFVYAPGGALNHMSIADVFVGRFE